MRKKIFKSACLFVCIVLGSITGEASVSLTERGVYIIRSGNKTAKAVF